MPAVERGLRVGEGGTGSFTGLHFIHSTSQDVYSNTATLDFYRPSYTSNYVVFTPIESETVTGAPSLQRPVRIS